VELQYQYVGPYGRGHHRARTPVGEVFYLQVVSVAPEQVILLPPEEWRSVTDVCRFIHMGGKLCERLRVSEGLYCEFHQSEFSLRAHFVGEVTNGYS
jgi:nitrite reductase/ring-hydroxylating ferredoxin subunit